MTEKKAEFQISIADAEADFDAVLARVEAGETIILTRDGQPVVCITPPPVYSDRGFGILDDPASEA
jgi:prevent-host-death family protein